MVAEKTDVLVVGGGAIGVCTAYFLAQVGRQVTLVERGQVCSGSSHGNAGLVVPSHSVPLAAPGVMAKGIRWMFNPESPFYIKPRFDRQLASWLWQFRAACRRGKMERSAEVIRDLSFASLALFEELRGLAGLDFAFEQRGMLGVYASEKGFAEAAEEARFLSEKGIEIQLLDGDGARQMAPGLVEAVVGGVFYPQDAHLLPHRFVGGLATIVGQRGADIRPQTEVLRFVTSGGRIERVVTTKGDFAPQQVVLAGGSWSAGIAAGLGLKLPIQAAKGYSITFERPDKAPTLPVMLGEAKVGVTPMGNWLRFAGTLELAGMDLSVNQRRVDAVLRGVPRYLPDLAPDRLKLVEIWRGLRPCTPDGLPFLGRVGRFDNLVVAAGHAMIGISLSPITGKLVAQLVEGQPPSLDLTPLAVERFA